MPLLMNEIVLVFTLLMNKIVSYAATDELNTVGFYLTDGQSLRSC